MPKRILQGVVTSDANAQTVTVNVERRFTHPVLKKTVRKSKTKRWEVLTSAEAEA
jgi:small subunit ribosomal protein S17